MCISLIVISVLTSSAKTPKRKWLLYPTCWISVLVVIKGYTGYCGLLRWPHVDK